jgi:hypothetical protein
MKTHDTSTEKGLFRVWLAQYEGPRPRRWSEVPRRAQAVEPADDRCVTEAAAREFVEGFNRVRRRDRLWAVAVPVVVRIDGEPRPGASLRAASLRVHRRQTVNSK